MQDKKTIFEKSTNLQELCKELNETPQTEAIEKILQDLPTFGGKELNGITGIYSWDAQSILTQRQDNLFEVVPRFSSREVIDALLQREARRLRHEFTPLYQAWLPGHPVSCYFYIEQNDLYFGPQDWTMGSPDPKEGCREKHRLDPYMMGSRLYRTIMDHRKELIEIVQDVTCDELLDERSLKAIFQDNVHVALPGKIEDILGLEIVTKTVFRLGDLKHIDLMIGISDQDCDEVRRDMYLQTHYPTNSLYDVMNKVRNWMEHIDFCWKNEIAWFDFFPYTEGQHLVIEAAEGASFKDFDIENIEGYTLVDEDIFKHCKKFMKICNP